jgi:penicillin-binding protein 2
VVQDVKNGEILALVSWPSFDPTPFATGISESEYQKLLTDPRRPLFNRAISASFPPGSTFKLVTATAALEEKVITPSTLIDDKGFIAVGSFIFKGWAPEGLGLVNLETAIAKSSDIYFYTVGGGYGSQRGVGVEKLADWARRLGLGAETGIDLVGEVSGLVPDEEWKLAARGEPWYIGNTYHMSIGQGDVLVTPLQLNNLVVAIANGGTLFKPFLVKDVPPEILRADVASAETLDLVRQGMRAAASPGGTAYPVYDFKVAVAGKTGTSETGGKEKTHAWFTCFAPFESPEIAVTVFLEEGGEGSHDTAPVARQILENYFKGR